MADSRCRRCHRKLKTPESIEVGFGSCCYKKIFGKTLKQASSKVSRRSSYRAAHQRGLEEHREELEGQMSIFDLETEV